MYTHEIMTLTRYLHECYLEELKTRKQAEVALIVNQPPPTIPVAKRNTSARAKAAAQAKAFIDQVGHAQEELDQRYAPNLNGYLAFVDRYMAINPAVRIHYLAHGLGVQLANNEIVALSVPSQIPPPMVDEGVPVTSVNRTPGGMANIPNSVIGITGRNG